MSTYFCDGLKEVTLLNGVTRLEFYRLQRSGGAGTATTFEPQPEIVVAMPTQGFLQALAELNRIRDRLMAEGAFQSTVAGSAAPPPVPGSD